MSFAFPAVFSSMEDSELLAEHKALPFPTPSRQRILWGRDPYLHSRLLTAILHEAHNRQQAVTAVYDPLLPDRIVALHSDSFGTVTTSTRRLFGNETLIDCNALLPPDGVLSETTEALALQKQRLATEIASVGMVLAKQRRLLDGVAQGLIDSPRLCAKVQRIIKQLPKGNGEAYELPLFTRQAGRPMRLPSPALDTVRSVVLQDTYGAASLFFNSLSDALQEQKLPSIRLTCVLTGEVMGIRLPTCGLCYWRETPNLSPCKQISLRQYLHPHTTEERRAWRNLAAAVGALEGHLDHLLERYRQTAKAEDEHLVSLYKESRLQNFRKRLLIDLFCSTVTSPDER